MDWGTSTGNVNRMWVEVSEQNVVEVGEYSQYGGVGGTEQYMQHISPSHISCTKDCMHGWGKSYAVPVRHQRGGNFMHHM